MISVENVITENFPSLRRKSQKIQKPLFAFLRYLCHEREFKGFASEMVDTENVRQGRDIKRKKLWLFYGGICNP